MKRYAWLLIVVWAMLGCIREQPDFPLPEPVAEDARVAVTITVPAQTLSPYTKSLGNEIDLRTLHLAVFGSSGYLKEYVKADILARESYTYIDPISGENRSAPGFTFSAKLSLADSKRTVHFIGNGPSTLPFGSADEVLPTLMTYLNPDPESADEQIQGFWQMIELPDGITAKKDVIDGVEVYVDKDGKAITPEGLRKGEQHYVVAESTEAHFKGIQLIRNWASIKVTAVGKNDHEGREFSNFEVISYALYNAPSRGAVVPYNTKKGKFMQNYQAMKFDDLEEDEYPANLPPGTELTKPEFIPENFQLKDDGEFKTPDSQGRVVKASAENSAVFLYERPVPTDRIPPTFVIVYGHYTDPDGEKPGHSDQSGDYFYKIDLYEIDRDNGVSRYFPVFRNFQYDINISKILSPGHSTPAAAASAAGNADVSADVTTSHLLDISDGQARLVISPWISHTFTSPVTEGSSFSTILQAIFFKPGENGQEIDTSPAAEKKVDVELRPMTDGSSDLITSCTIGDPNPDSEQKGWRTITFTTAENSSGASRSQTIRIKGTYKEGNTETGRDVTLYRDVVITVQPKQDLHVSIESTDFVEGAMPRELNKVLTLHVDIPDGLVESMFPLEFKIEPEDMTLTPVDTDLPVFFGPSISLHDGYRGKSAFYFIRTITYEQYRALTRWTDDMDLTWRRFDCHFKTTKAENATTIWVQNDEFFNYTDNSRASFSNIDKAPREKINYFYVEAADDEGCQVRSASDGIMYLQTKKVNETTEYWVKEEGWSGSTGKSITLEKGDRVYFKAGVKNWSGEDKLKVDGNFNVGGNIASLVVGDDFEVTGASQTGVNFSSFLKNKSGLKDASHLTIPMTDLTKSTFQSMFEGCTSMTAAPELPATTLNASCYLEMFKGCTSLTTAPVLSATSLANYCYQSMFEGCSSLTTAPVLPAGTLTNSCYKAMFKNSGLTASPRLAAKTLVDNCYEEMFSGCSSLVEITMIATSISASNCLKNWVSDVSTTGDFYRDRSVSIPVSSVNGIPPTNWVDRNEFYIEAVAAGTLSYSGSGLQYSVDWDEWKDFPMAGLPLAAGDLVRFRRTSKVDGAFSSTEAFNVGGEILSIVAGKNYPTATLTISEAFKGLFKGASTLVSAENLILPATVTANCYEEMFSGSTSLTSAPTLSATTLTTSCYKSMFSGCTSLATAPTLPATALASNCYEGMFQGCISLTSSPKLPAETLVSNCYKQMFSGCKSLSFVVLSATGDIRESQYTEKWLDDVAENGFMLKSKELVLNINDVSGVPSGWSPDAPFFIEARAATCKVKINKTGLKYNIDGSGWEDYNTANTEITITEGKKMFLGSASGILDWSGKPVTVTGNFAIGGNIASLIVGYTNFYGATGENAKGWKFTEFMSGKTNLVDASYLDLPMATVGDSGYKSFFNGCTKLVDGPAMIAATEYNKEACYQMFYGCTSLKAIPSFPSMVTLSGTSIFYQMFQSCTSLTSLTEPLFNKDVSLAKGCFQDMFAHCSSISTICDGFLPAATLAEDCYRGMFQHNTALEKAPDLKAATLQATCYRYMFFGCTKLKSVRCWATNPNTTILQNWMNGVASSGDFYIKDGVNWPSPRGVNSIPVGWTIHTE